MPRVIPRLYRDVSVKASEPGSGIGLYLKRIFALMFGAVALTAIASYITIYAGGISLLVNTGGLSWIFYVILFGAFGLSIWAQARAFHMSPAFAAFLLAIYSILMGFAITPLVWGALNVNPASILQAFVISSVMFGCMALFGYKTVKDLSFLKTFLYMGMVGLLLVWVVNMIWPLNSLFATIVCAFGVLLFALFTAYDMQKLKSAYNVITDNTQRNQLAVLGALHLYISFIAMFQNILSLLNMRK